jgi:hypothetical protein
LLGAVLRPPAAGRPANAPDAGDGPGRPRPARAPSPLAPPASASRPRSVGMASGLGDERPLFQNRPPLCHSYQATVPILPTIRARWPCGGGGGPLPPPGTALAYGLWYGGAPPPVESPTACFGRRGGVLRPVGRTSHDTLPDRPPARGAANSSAVRAGPLRAGSEVTAALEGRTARSRHVGPFRAVTRSAATRSP